MQREEQKHHEELISYLISLVAESCGHHNKLVVVNIKVTIAEPTVNLNNDRSCHNEWMTTRRRTAVL
jgi:hypothetical protein